MTSKPHSVQLARDTMALPNAAIRPGHEVRELAKAVLDLFEQLEALHEAGQQLYDTLTFVAYWEPRDKEKVNKARAKWERTIIPRPDPNPAREPEAS